MTDVNSGQPAPPTPPASPASRQRKTAWFIALLAAGAIFSALIAALLVTIFERKQEAKNPYVRVVEVNEGVTDPAVWGRNWPMQYDSYQRTADATRTRFGGHGGSEAMPEEKIERDPWLRRMFAGYAFALDYRDRRGHAYMLADQEITERVTQRPQPGACLHCHASVVPTWRRVGEQALGQSTSDPDDFNWPAVLKGFETMSAMTYSQAHAELLKTPDGSPNTSARQPAPQKTPQTAPQTTPSTRAALAHNVGEAHPVSCVDCHEPSSMQLRVTRPGLTKGLAALARSDDPVPHLPSVERWRKGSRSKDFDPNADATRQEMRSLVCAQCHVEYYCGPKTTLFFPWERGLKVQQIEAVYDNLKFPDGTPFLDYKHGETGAPIYKAQHPEFELWSQGIHARSGVSCADCHMPYERVGATKVSDHWVRSPLLNVNRACQVCHKIPEAEIKSRVDGIQQRTFDLLQRAAAALMAQLDAITAARKAGVTEEQLKPALDLHRKAQWRLDFIAAENSMGFHASQEAARILAEAIDYARQGQAIAQAQHLRRPTTPATMPATQPIRGITPKGKAPTDANQR